MVITYTPAGKTDAALLYQLCKKLIDDYEDTTAIDYEKVLSWVKWKIETNIFRYTRILADGVLAGFYCLDVQSGELDDLYILEPFQGKGLGSTVVRQCMEESHVPLWLYVFKKNTGAIRLYQRLGLQICKEVGSTRYIMQEKPRQN